MGPESLPDNWVAFLKIRYAQKLQDQFSTDYTVE